MEGLKGALSRLPGLCHGQAFPTATVFKIIQHPGAALFHPQNPSTQVSLSSFLIPLLYQREALHPALQYT